MTPDQWHTIAMICLKATVIIGLLAVLAVAADRMEARIEREGAGDDDFGSGL